MSSGDNVPVRLKYRPYFIAVALAFVLTMIVAPEIHETKSMEPAISEGSLVVLQKKTFSEKRGMPEKGDLIVLKKHVLEGAEEDNAIRRVVSVDGGEVFFSCDNEEFAEENPQVAQGTISADKIRGKAVFVVWPLSDIGVIE